MRLWILEEMKAYTLLLSLFILGCDGVYTETQMDCQPDEALDAQRYRLITVCTERVSNSTCMELATDMYPADCKRHYMFQRRGHWLACDKAKTKKEVDACLREKSKYE